MKNNRTKNKPKAKWSKIAKRVLLVLIPIALVAIIAISMKTNSFAAELDENPLTPDGSGTLVDQAQSGGKEFFTIVTADGNVFYIIIDRERDINNVYFLNSVTERDMISLVPEIEEMLKQPPVDTQTPPDPTPNNGDNTEKSGSFLSENMGLIILGAFALVGAGIFAYVKFGKKKKSKSNSDDNFAPAPRTYSDDNDEDGDEE